MLRCCRLTARLFPPACAHHAPRAAFALVGMDGLDAMARTCCYASSASYAVDADSATTILPSERSRDDALARILRAQTDESRASGTFKRERVISGAQGASVEVVAGGVSSASPSFVAEDADDGGAQLSVINFCANNYLVGRCMLTPRSGRLVDPAFRALGFNSLLDSTFLLISWFQTSTCTPLQPGTF